MSCTGRVKFFLPDKGWGRLELTGPPPENLPASEVSNGVFVHLKDVAAVDENTLASLEEGQEVCFSVAEDEKGWRATEVRGLDGNPIKTRLHRTMLAGIFRGVVAHWNSERSFGWIATDLSPQSLGMQRVPKAALGLNGGRVYFRWRDCGPSHEGQEAFVHRGKAVVFQLYWDEKGLGALHVCDAINLRPLSTQGGGADYYKQLLAIQQLPGSEQLTELSKEMDKCTLCLVVTRAQAGSIIGQKGETVKALKEHSGVDRIYAENGPSDHRLVEIKGAPAAVASAVLLIAEQLAKDPGSQAAGAQPGVVPPAPGGPLEVRVVVPDEGFGRVVGKGKAQISAIEERCPGSTVQIAQRVSVGSLPVQAIAVGGTPDAMAEATRMLIVRVVSCCGGAAAPLMTGPAAMVPYGQGGGQMGAMLMLQANMQQMGGGKGGGRGGGKGAPGGGGGPGGFGGGGRGGAGPGGPGGPGGGVSGLGPGGGGPGGRGAGGGGPGGGFAKGGPGGKGRGGGGGRGGAQAPQGQMPGGAMPGHGPGMGPGGGPGGQGMGPGAGPGGQGMGAALRGGQGMGGAPRGPGGGVGVGPGPGGGVGVGPGMALNMGMGPGGPVMGPGAHMMGPTGPQMGPGMVPGGLPGGGMMFP